jgi:hypothetical protein
MTTTTASMLASFHKTAPMKAIPIARKEACRLMRERKPTQAVEHLRSIMAFAEQAIEEIRYAFPDGNPPQRRRMRPQCN